MTAALLVIDVPRGLCSGKHGLIVLDQICTLDRALAALRAPTLAATLQTLQAMFAP
jgi:nicotinamidase-related amidase